MEKSIFYNNVKKEDIVPLLTIQDTHTNINYIFGSEYNPNYDFTKESIKNKYTPQGFLQSITIYRIKEMLSHLLFKSEIPPEDLHLSALCLCNDGRERVVSIDTEFMTNYGERMYPEGDMGRNKETRSSLSDILSYRMKDITHYPLYECNIIPDKLGSISLFLNNKSNLPDTDKKDLLQELYFKTNSYPSDETERKNYIVEQDRMLKDYCKEINDLVATIHKTNTDGLQQSISFSNLVASYNKQVFRSVQPSGAISFDKVFEVFPEKILNYELLYIKYRNIDNTSIYRFIKSAFSTHTDKLLKIDRDQNNYIIDRITELDSEKITPKKTSKLINLFKTKTYMELFDELRDKEYILPGTEKNSSFIEFIIRLPNPTGNLQLINDNYASFVVFPDCSIVVRLLKFNDSFLNVDRYIGEIEPIVYKIRENIIKITETTKFKLDTYRN